MRKVMVKKSEISLLDDEEFKRFLYLQAGKEWIRCSNDEINCLRHVIDPLQPRSIVDWGCGVGRSAVSLSQEFDLFDSEWRLYDMTGMDLTNVNGKSWVHENGIKNGKGMGCFGDATIRKPYNNLEITRRFCELNGLTPEVIDIDGVCDVGSPDLFYSFNCIGYHFSIRSFLDSVEMSPRVMVFGIRRRGRGKQKLNPCDVDEIEGYDKEFVRGTFFQNYLVFTRI